MKDKNKQRDPNWYKKIGALGGRAKNKMKGFGANRELASLAGKLGGRKRGKNTPEQQKDIEEIVKSLEEAKNKT